MFKLNLFFLMTVLLLSVPGFSVENRCSDKIEITDGGVKKSLVQYLPSESASKPNPRTIISGIYKFVWNGQTINVFRCSKNSSAPYFYNEDACTTNHAFKPGGAVLKNSNGDVLIKVLIEGSQLTIQSPKQPVYKIDFAEQSTNFKLISTKDEDQLGKALGSYKCPTDQNRSASSNQSSSGSRSTKKGN